MRFWESRKVPPTVKSKKLIESLPSNDIPIKIRTTNRWQRRISKKSVRLMKFFQILRKELSTTNMDSTCRSSEEGAASTSIILEQILTFLRQMTFFKTFLEGKTHLMLSKKTSLVTFSQVLIKDVREAEIKTKSMIRLCGSQLLEDLEVLSMKILVLADKTSRVFSLKILWVEWGEGAHRSQSACRRSLLTGGKSLRK